MRKLLLGIFLILLTIPGSFGMTTLYSLVASVIFIICITLMMLFSKKNLTIDKFLFVVLLIYALQIITLTFLSNFSMNDYSLSIKYISASMIVIILIYIIMYRFSKDAIDSILKYVIYVIGILGFLSQFIFKSGINQIINENQISLMVYPALVYLLFSKKYGLFTKMFLYFLGIVILYYIGGRTTAIIFIITPLLFVFFKNKMKMSVYFIIVLIGFYMMVYIIDPSSVYFARVNDLLSDRLTIYHYYLNYTYDGIVEKIFGTGLIEGQVYDWRTINSHNTWINYMFFQGILGVVVNIGIILYTLIKSKKSDMKNVVLIAGTLMIQLLETVYLFSMGYTSFLLSFLLIYQMKFKENQNEWGEKK